uniref:Uncharacterized protein n=1 Tax=Oryza punctata TaxID=4537 RepID=A0A0E0M4M8_ORYPU
MAIPIVESLASVFRSVSRSLERLGAASPTKSFWTRNYLRKLQGSLDIGLQSLSLLERTFYRLESKLADKVRSLAAIAAATIKAANKDRLEYKQVDKVGSTAADKAGVNSVLIFVAVGNERSANCALSAYRSFLEVCRATMTAFDDMQRSIKDKLLNVAGAGENLQDNIRFASGMTRILADFLGPWILTSYGTEGIPPTMQIAFRFCREHLWSIKTCADTPFLLLGCGAFNLRRRMKLSVARMRCLQSSEAVSRSLERLGAASPTKSFWTCRNYLRKLQGSLDIAWQSLSLLERTLDRLQSKQAEEVKSLAAVAAAVIKTCAGEVAIRYAVTNELHADIALSVYRDFEDICRVNMIALNDMQRAIKDKLSSVPGAGENLQSNIKRASSTTRILACHLGPWIQTINGIQGIPPTIKIAFSFCREHMWSVKTCADTPFLLLGCGAFTLRRRLKLCVARMRCLPLQSSEASETLCTKRS